jgi:hypothetical protein
MKERFKRLLGDGSRGYQMVAQAAAARCLKLQCVGHIFWSDQICLDEQVAQSHACFDGVLLVLPGELGAL